MSMSEKVYLLFRSNTPGVEKDYFHRVAEVGSGERGRPPKTQVIVSTTVEDATGFSPEHAIAARDGYRKQGYDCWIEATTGERLYDNHQSTPQIEAQLEPEHRTCFVAVTGAGVPHGHGYIVRYNPQQLDRGGWYITANSVPSLVESRRHEAMATLWGSSPEDVVNKAIQMWTVKVAVPFANPLNPVLNAYHNQKLNKHEASSNTNSSARLRPGCRR
jgi:hypothetical protein